MNDKTIFCAHCQDETNHILSASEVNDAEVIAVCAVCGRSLKFPSSLTPEEFDQLLAIHKEDNHGQEPVTVESAPVEPAQTPEVPAPAEPAPAEASATANVLPVTNAPVEPAASELGPRTQDDLSPQEQATWEQMQPPVAPEPAQEPTNEPPATNA